LFKPDSLEFYGLVNLLKGAIVFSDRLTTVSAQYAKEIQTPQYGCGMEGVLRDRADRLTGILNGIDVKTWDPQSDPALPARFSRGDKSNKARCKQDVQNYFGLPPKPGVPLLAIISRLIPQKGFDILTQAMPRILEEGVQLVLLGTGMPEYQEEYAELHKKRPSRIGLELGFNEPLAHRIEAGADLFLMPSQFEPCGLNQLYSLRYGTIPIVRRTGGLADSIVDATPSTIVWGKATGFVFAPYTASALLASVRRAVALYSNNKPLWTKLVDNAMAQDFSWERSARRYEALMLEMIKD
jgi:starch synthase